MPEEKREKIASIGRCVPVKLALRRSITAKWREDRGRRRSRDEINDCGDAIPSTMFYAGSRALVRTGISLLCTCVKREGIAGFEFRVATTRNACVRVECALFTASADFPCRLTRLALGKSGAAKENNNKKG